MKGEGKGGKQRKGEGRERYKGCWVGGQSGKESRAGKRKKGAGGCAHSFVRPHLPALAALEGADPVGG